MDRASGAERPSSPARAERVGPYLVFRELAAGAGVRFVEAEGPDGARVTLQIVRLRPVSDEADRMARVRYERGLGAKTAALFDEPELEIRAQGCADVPDGGRLSFWAVRLGGAPFGSTSPVEIDAALRALLERLARRHAKGRFEPWLSEHAIWRHADGRVAIAGVPVAVDPSWMAAPELARVAPGEPIDRDASGDLWRLGLALEALSLRVPACAAHTIGARLRARELTSADEALRALSALAAARRPSAPPPALRLGVDGPTAKIDFPVPKSELSPFEAVAPDVGTDPALGASDAVTHQMRARTLGVLPVPVLVSSGELAAADPSEIKTSTHEYAEPAGLAPVVSEPSMDAAAAAWAPALFPEGASPWSEVVKPRPARRSSFTGFSGELPDVNPDEIVEPSPLVRDSLAPGPKLPIPAPLPPQPQPRAQISPGRRMAVASAATLLVLGLVALWGRARPAPIEAMDGAVFSAVNEVWLDSEPRGASVVSELDGRVIGTTPLKFMVAAGADSPLLVFRAGSDPQRVTLPDRGGLVASLGRLPVERCSMRIDVPAGVEIEGVGVDIGAGPTHTIPGAAVVRARAEDYAGARIVRCPEVGPERSVRLRFGAPVDVSSVRITHPAGGAASIEGVEVGVIPASSNVRAAYARVKVSASHGGAVERWVATRGDVEVQMPPPEEPAPEPAPPTIIESTPVAIERERPSGRESARHRAEALVLLREGTELLQAGHADLAKARLQACLRADPGAAACHRGLGEAFRRSDATTQARLHYARYLELQPDAPDASFVKSLLRQM